MDTRSTPIETPTTSATSATAVTSSMSRSSSGSKVGVLLSTVKFSREKLI